MEKIKQDWSKSYIVQPRNHLVSHIFINEKHRFKPSYENDVRPASMNSLIGWEYSRKWLEERNAFIEDRLRKVKPKRINNDYQKWLDKRKPKAYTSCAPQGIRNIKKKCSKNK